MKMKKTLMIALGLVAAGLFADEIAWPADFWDKVNARLADVEANCSVASGQTPDALDTAMTSSKSKTWATDFWSWVSSEDFSSGTDVDFRPAGLTLVIR